jgi:hypothetical protein
MQKYDMKGRDHAEHRSVDVKIILEWILGTQDGSMCVGFVWLRIGTSDGLL